MALKALNSEYKLQRYTDNVEKMKKSGGFLWFLSREPNKATLWKNIDFHRKRLKRSRILDKEHEEAKLIEKFSKESVEKSWI